MRRTIAAGLALLTIALAAGCGLFEEERACTLVGCSDGLFVDIALRDPQEGMHAVEGRLDGAPFRCEIDVRAGTGGRPPTCTDERIEPGAIYGGSEPSPGLILRFNDFLPEEVELRLLRGDAELGSWSLQPDYQETAPNGYECGPVCQVASVDLHE